MSRLGLDLFQLIRNIKQKAIEKEVTEFDVFKSKEYAQSLMTDGVIKVPLLDENALDKIRSFYAEIHSDEHPTSFFDGIHMTIWDEDNSYKSKIREELRSILQPYFDTLFTNYRALSQQFIVKLTGKETTFPVHQDWCIVNETKYFSLNIWIPIQDVDEKNGAMWIVKGSHQLNQPIRGAGTLFPNYLPVFEKLKPYMTSFPMKAGEALIFYHSTIHGSPFNLTNNPRITVQTSVVPQIAPMEIYFQPPGERSVEIHHPEDNFNFYYKNIREESSVKPPTNLRSQIIENFKLKEVSIKKIKRIQKSL